MKTKILVMLGLFSFVFTFMGAERALAVVSGAIPIRRIYGAQPVAQYNAVELVASTVKGMQAVQVNNTGDHAIELEFGPAGSEVAQVIVGGRQDTGTLPLQAGYATRLSVIALDGPNETGELEVNVFYN